jgi:hypothetical protein
MTLDMQEMAARRDSSRCETIASETASKAWYLWPVDGICWSNGAFVESRIVATKDRTDQPRASTFRGKANGRHEL